MTDKEKKFSVTKKEALALVFALNHFRAYLLGTKFSLITELSALRWLHLIEAKGHLGRWVMDLQEYQFAVHQRPGIENGNADAFTRLPKTQYSKSPTLDPSDSYKYNYATTITPGYNLQAKQVEDLSLGKIIQLKLDSFPTPLNPRLMEHD